VHDIWVSFVFLKLSSCWGYWGPSICPGGWKFSRPLRTRREERLWKGSRTAKVGTIIHGYTATTAWHAGVASHELKLQKFAQGSYCCHHTGEEWPNFNTHAHTYEDTHTKNPNKTKNRRKKKEEKGVRGLKNQNKEKEKRKKRGKRKRKGGEGRRKKGNRKRGGDGFRGV